MRISGRALHVGNLVDTCRCPVVYSAVCTGFLHMLTTRRNMAVERDVKQQINLNLLLSGTASPGRCRVQVPVGQCGGQWFMVRCTDIYPKQNEKKN